MNNIPISKVWPKPTLPLKFDLNQWVIELSTQQKYVITSLPDDKVIKTEKGWKPAYGYRHENDGPECCRAQNAMEDGRFIPIAAPEHYSGELSYWGFSKMMTKNFSGGELDTLIALAEDGPLFDGDVPSKKGSDTLIKMGYAVETVVKGKCGYQAITAKGIKLYLERFNASTISEAILNRKNLSFSA